MGVGVCTAGILKGVEYVEKMCYDLSKRLAELGYSSIQEVNRAAHPNFPSEEHISGLKFHFTPFKEDGTTKKCVSCKKCETVCCYDARKLTFPEMTVDMDKCRCCGLCLDVCPQVPSPQSWLLRQKRIWNWHRSQRTSTSWLSSSI